MQVREAREGPSRNSSIVFCNSEGSGRSSHLFSALSPMLIQCRCRGCVYSFSGNASRGAGLFGQDDNLMSKLGKQITTSLQASRRDLIALVAFGTTVSNNVMDVEKSISMGMEWGR